MGSYTNDKWNLEAERERRQQEYPWGNQPNAAMQMVAWFSSLEGHYRNFKEGICVNSAWQDILDAHIETGRVIVKHIEGK